VVQWLPEDDPLWYWTPARALSLLVAVAYILLAILLGDQADAVMVGACLLLPLACIWFPEPMGDFIGSSGRGYVDRPSPDRAIFIAGWVLLFLPVLILPFAWLVTR
jgi:hypothetical protein